MAGRLSTLWQSSTIIGSSVRASDGGIGSVADILFDDQAWTVRWAVVDTGTWLPGKRVLLPTAVLGEPDAASGSFPVQATRQQVKDSPGVEQDQPVSRQLETDIHGYYGWSPYWSAGIATHPGMVPPMMGVAGAPSLAGRVPEGEAPPGQAGAGAAVQRGDPRLRSLNEVLGYYIQASDDSIGHAEEFLLDPQGWAIRYLVVDTRNWWPGRKVLVDPKWIGEVDWNGQMLHVGLTREQVRGSPEYDPAATADQDYEQRLYGHYGRIPYWR